MTLLAAAAALGACGSGAAGGRTTHTTRTVPRSHHARGMVVLVPGSGFRGAGEHDARTLSIKPATWRRWGFRTWVAAYGPGRAGPVDVATALAAAHGAAPALPLCIYGESSGGTWALVAAASDPAVDCVVVGAAPTDEETWARSRTRIARYFTRNVWPGYFGPPSRDNGFEPYDVWQAARPNIPVLAVYASGDPLVSPQQGQIFAGLGPDTTLRTLAPGRHYFVHSKVSSTQFARAVAAVRRFALARAQAAAGGG
jgi:predicted alpha/beta-fold hydrolase